MKESCVWTKQAKNLNSHTLYSPVHKKCPWAVSDSIEPAIMSILQNPQEEESSKPVQWSQKSFIASISLLIN